MQSFRKLKQLFEGCLTDPEILAKLSSWKKISKEYGWIDSSGNGPQTVDPSQLESPTETPPSSSHSDAHQRIPDGSLLLDEDFAMMHAPPNAIRPHDVEVLDVSLEHIGGISRDVKEYFTSLRMLVLNGNDIRVFPSLSSMETLQVVHAKDNQVDSFNASALPLAIEELDLSLNRLVCFDSGRPATQLKRVRLESNGIESFDGSLFPSLRELRLYRNELVDVRCIRPCQLLQVVDLGRNHIFDMEDLGMTHPLLIDLVLYENQISKIAPNWSCVLLKSLYLNGNQIEKLPEMIHLPMLETLQLQENKIESIKFSSSCISLKYLDLSFNRIANPLELQNLRPLASLQTLSLSDNPVTKHP
jgi:Leucine-rich repeat (LRR) protein